MYEKKYLDTNTSDTNERITRKSVKNSSWIAKYNQNIYKYKRYANNPNQWFNDVGFRCVKSLGV